MNSVQMFDSIDSYDIAIIGMSCSFPGAKDIDAFWQNLQTGVESISFFSDQELETSDFFKTDTSNANFVKAGGIIKGFDLFDASFFNISAREALWIDPQQRMFLECAWSTIENAGYNVKTYKGAIGIYAGASMSTYLLSLLPYLKSTADVYQALIANDKDFLTTRVSYKLNLRGESITVQTACSTSLVAVHMACQSLLSGQCDMALAGGVSIRLPQKTGYLYQEGMILSPNGHCRAFDARANGIAIGNGLGLVLLKPLCEALKNGDYVYAVIKGSAINNDGNFKVGYTAPSVAGQADVVSKALAIAGVEAETISYVEAHGTGTPLGDPIEIEALTKVFRQQTDRKMFCAIGSVKTNIGHLDAAAGIAGLIKTVLSLKHKQIPPSLHFEKPNPTIDFGNSPFYVNTTLSEWTVEKTRRRAGVSSFGIGGTNAHVILEEAPLVKTFEKSRFWHLLVLSAKTSSALETATANLIEYFKQHPDVNLADLAYTYQIGRQVFSHRRILVFHDLNDAVTALETLDSQRVFTRSQKPKNRPVVFMFPGQGAQYINMALELYQVETTFQKQVDICSELLKPSLGLDLRNVIYPKEEQIEEATQQLKQTYIAQSALFVIEYALAKLWMVWGVQPQAMIGHSIGEYVAACLAGVFSLEDALALVVVRGKLIQELPRGGMLAVPLPEKEVYPLLDKALSLAAINGSSLCVISGPMKVLAQLDEQLAKKGVVCRYLHTSHAFHSKMMDSILEPFTEQVRKVTLNPPEIHYISNVSGTWITAAEATDPSYWAKHLRQTVRFAEGLHELLKEPEQILLEVGPGRTLSKLVMRHSDYTSGQIVVASLRHPQEQQSDLAFLLNALGQIWLAEIQVDWFGFYANERRHRIPLPTYPFERQRYCIESQKRLRELNEFKSTESSAAIPDSIDKYFIERVEFSHKYSSPRNVIEDTISNIWSDVLGLEAIGIYDNFFELGGDSLLATQIFSRLKQAFFIDISLEKMLSYQSIAQLSEVIQNEIQPEEGKAKTHYYCSFEMKMGDEIITIYITEEEYRCQGLPDGAINFNIL